MVKKVDCLPSEKMFPDRDRPLARFWRIPLYSNALYLITGNGLGALLGFVYWAVAARFYSTSDVGLMSAAIAAMGLLGSLSNLGLGTGLVRYLPRADRQAAPVINFSLSVVAVMATVLAIIFLLGSGLWSPGLSAFRDDGVLSISFIVFSACAALTTVTDGVFIARRRAGFAMARGLSMNILKLALVIVLASLSKASGIFTSWGAALGVSLLLGLFVFLPRLIPGYLPKLNLNWRGRGELARYSLVNNLAVLLSGIPGQVLPIMLLGRLGAESNAFFFIALQITVALSAVSSSIATSLFAEGCHDEKELVDNAWRSLRLAFAILAPLVIIVTVFSGTLLRIFGAAYAEHSTLLLQVLAFSLFPMTVNQVYFAVLRVQKKLRALTLLNGFIALAALAASYLLLPSTGTLGAGVAWVASQTLVALWIVTGQGRHRLVWRKLLSIFSRGRVFNG